ncbi:preprotein translocase subunit SecG [Altererythrobacter aurantiacus]|uniref:Protein-export membrane protein SecG n=1 Tax=Parapontixanthobacter aurantiacus TaxID=1463599 RepID=A0A844ZBS8_9SPHN|nr:preprotein translocase subunit SecG [Parapontixanthobacter aurantiacus]MXO85365.1 preprotein translocase subunit SecG [Parapontixanthobacter aurantiacus]
MSLFVFLTVVQAIVAAALVGVILMQRSEGGGLGIGGGGSPSGMLSARGAADFLTRSTKMLAILFVALSIALAAVAVETTGIDEITSTIDRSVTPAGQPDPLSGGTGSSALGAPAPVDGGADDTAPASTDPLAE